MGPYQVTEPRLQKTGQVEFSVLKSNRDINSRIYQTLVSRENEKLLFDTTFMNY